MAPITLPYHLHARFCMDVIKTGIACTEILRSEGPLSPSRAAH